MAQSVPHLDPNSTSLGPGTGHAAIQHFCIHIKCISFTYEKFLCAFTLHVETQLELIPTLTSCCMLTSDTYPILGAIRLKVDRWNKCNNLISDIIRLLAPPKPQLQMNCNHVIQGPFLDLGVADLERAGQYHQLVRFLFT